MTDERRPFVRWEISVGNIAVLATLVLMLIQGGQLVGQVRAEIGQQRILIEEVRTSAAAREARITAVERVAAAAAEMAGQDARRVVELEARLRAAEQGSARFDERLASLQTDLRRIIAIVERIDRNGGYQKP
jgi:hypothetical protein